MRVKFGSQLCLLLLALALYSCRPASEPIPTIVPNTPFPQPSPRPVEDFSEIRPAAVADAFYPADPGQAADMVEQFLAPVRQVDGQPIALIVPHAGWVYSGQVAAAAYKQIQGQQYDAIVIIAPNHTDPAFDAISVYAQGAFETPGGPVPVDEELAAQLLAAHERIVFDRGVHQDEHSIEVQLPFLQRVCPNCSFVPIIIGQPTPENLDILVQALADALRDKRALLIASSDLSHYPAYDDAVYVDTTTLAAIETQDAELVSNVIAEQMSQGAPGLVTCACGEGGILVVMRVARELGADHVRILSYANSGDVGGDTSRVVGYGAVMFWRWQAPDLDAAQRAELLSLARRSIEGYLETGKKTTFDPPEDAALERLLGAFVTLTQEGELRGCIGHMQGDAPLYQTVAQVAIDAAVNDPRFPALTLAEFLDDGVEIKISVLSPLKRVRDVYDEAEIEVGRHGLYLLYGQQRGVLLPQVPVEQGWDRAEFLEQICAKSGLPAGCWERATLYTFTAHVFDEGQ